MSDNFEWRAVFWLENILFLEVKGPLRSRQGRGGQESSMPIRRNNHQLKQNTQRKLGT